MRELRSLLLLPLFAASVVCWAAPDNDWDRQLAAAKLLLRDGLYAEAEVAFWHPFETAESGAQRIRAVANLNSVALAYCLASRYSEAEKLYRRLLDLWADNRIPPDKYEVVILIGLATLYQRQNKFASALPLYRRAVDRWNSMSGPDNAGVAPIMASLAEVLYLMGRHREAKRWYEAALFIEQQTLGSEHPSTATILNNLAAVAQATGRYDDAADLYRKALKIQEAALGLQHPRVAKTLNNLATVEAERGNYRYAGELYRRAAAILVENARATGDPTLMVVLSNLAQLYLSHGRYAEAAQVNQCALTEGERSLGGEHPALMACLLNHARMLRKLRRRSEAAQYEARALAIKSKHGPDLRNYSIDISILSDRANRRKTD